MIDNLLEIAVTVAKQSTMRKRYGCLVIYQNQIISTGYNMRIGFSYEREKIKKRTSYHAERNALCKIKDRKILPKCKIYIIRIDRNGFIHDAIPCAKCSKYLQKKKITGVYTIEKKNNKIIQ